MTILVTGGADYIGSHVVLGLIDRNERVVALDNLGGSREPLSRPRQSRSARAIRPQLSPTRQLLS